MNVIKMRVPDTFDQGCRRLRIARRLHTRFLSPELLHEVVVKIDFAKLYTFGDFRDVDKAVKS